MSCGRAWCCPVPPFVCRCASSPSQLNARLRFCDPRLSRHRAIITQSFKTSSKACRALFFSPALPDEAVDRYRAALAAGPKLPLIADRATTEGRWPRPPADGWPRLPPRCVFVGWGAGDVLIDRRAAEETAAFFGAQLTTWEEGVAHDAMLDVGWRSVAASLLAWLEAVAAASGA